MTHARPEFIYFDMGNVLMSFDHEQAFRQAAEIANVDIAFMRRFLVEEGRQESYEIGAINTEQLHREFCEQTQTAPDLNLLKNALSDIFELNLSLVPFVAQLRAANLSLGILSNTCDAHWEYIRNRFTLIRECFSVNVLSYETQCAKPDRKIYELAAEKVKCEPAKIFFVDDLEVNVQGAQKAGLDAVQYTTAPELASQLYARGIQLNF